MSLLLSLERSLLQLLKNDDLCKKIEVSTSIRDGLNYPYVILEIETFEKYHTQEIYRCNPAFVLYSKSKRECLGILSSMHKTVDGHIVGGAYLFSPLEILRMHVQQTSNLGWKGTLFTEIYLTSISEDATSRTDMVLQEKSD